MKMMISTQVRAYKEGKQENEQQMVDYYGVAMDGEGAAAEGGETAAQRTEPVIFEFYSHPEPEREAEAEAEVGAEAERNPAAEDTPAVAAGEGGVEAAAGGLPAVPV